METNMTVKEALDILEHHNLWRRGADIEQIDPKVVGMALDKSIEVLRLFIVMARNYNEETAETKYCDVLR